MDILDAHIHPFDLVSKRKQFKLQSEISHEKEKIKAKFIFKYGRTEADPFKLWS